MQPLTDPERQIENARASLLVHLGELGRRVKAARARFDLRAHVAAHPLASVGVAFAAGALLGLRGGGKPRPDGASGQALGRVAVAAISALAVRIAKELAMIGATDAARRWWEHRQHETSSETRTSYDPGVESFLEH
jgi:hypothetical protein